jgi:hypothetical protein
MVCFNLYCSETGNYKLPKSMGLAAMFYLSGGGFIRACSKLLQAVHLHGPPENADCVSDLMLNPFHNVNSCITLSSFSVEVCAQIGPRGGAGGRRRGEIVRPPQAAESKGQ